MNARFSEMSALQSLSDLWGGVRGVAEPDKEADALVHWTYKLGRVALSHGGILNVAAPGMVMLVQGTGSSGLAHVVLGRQVATAGLFSWDLMYKPVRSTRGDKALLGKAIAPVWDRAEAEGKAAQDDGEATATTWSGWLSIVRRKYQELGGDDIEVDMTNEFFEGARILLVTVPVALHRDVKKLIGLEAKVLIAAGNEDIAMTGKFVIEYAER